MSEQVGQTAGFESFFVVQHPRLVAIALGWCGDADAAREVAQEALTRALRDWDRVSRLEVPGAWVWRVTINLLIDRRRRQGRISVLCPNPLAQRHDSDTERDRDARPIWLSVACEPRT